MICYDPQQRVFLLAGRRSAYLLRVLAGGEVLHLAHRVADAPARGLPRLRLDDYPGAGFNSDVTPHLYELPVQGDVHHHAVVLRVAFPHAPRAPGPGEAAHLPVRDLRLRYVSHEIRDDALPAGAPAHGEPVQDRSQRQTLCLHLRDAAYPFDVSVFYRLTPEHDVIERWLELRHGCDGPVVIEHAGYGAMHLPAGDWEAAVVSGTWGSEFRLHRQRLAPGCFEIGSRTLTTSHLSNPFFHLARAGRYDETAGEVYFGGIAHSGNWHLGFDTRSTGALLVKAGPHPDDAPFELAPGETHRTPAFFGGVSAEGTGGASRRLHAFARERVLPWCAAQPWRPVLYNSWEATYFDVSEASQVRLARVAAELGCELFVMDDGWFGERRHDRAGLGDWVVRNDAFPNGLQPLIDEVQRLGMQFGLWMEPEMVNPDSDLYRAHPDWVLHYPGRPRTQQRHQLLLDFGRPEVVAHIERCLDALFDRYPIRFVKWDMNRYATEAGSAAGSRLWQRHVEAVYALMDRLRRRHPRLAIESCSAGGGRVDLGILGRVDQVWTSDNTDAWHRIGIQEGFSHAYPARAMMNWVSHEHNHQTGLAAPLALRFDVAMRGSLGIGSAIAELGAGERVQYAERIAFYKRIRPIVQGGDLHRLEQVAEHGVSAWQFVAREGRQSVLSLVERCHRFGDLRPPLRLRGLLADAEYGLSDFSGAHRGRYSGWQLMTIGLPARLETGFRQEGWSETLLLEVM